MKYLSRYKKLLVLNGFWLLLPLVGCTQKVPEPQKSCYFVQNKHEQRVSWKSNLPVKFRVHKDVPKEARESITQAAKEWNLISTKNVIQIVSWDAEGTPSKSYADRVPTIFWKKDWEVNKASEQARTIVVWSGNTLRDADIWINAKNFTFSYYGDEFGYMKVDLVSLVVHEMGHALGFAHTTSRESIMYPRLARGFDRRSVDHLKDLEAFSCEYGDSIVEPSVMLAAIEEHAETVVAAEVSVETPNEELNNPSSEEPTQEGLVESVNNASQSSQVVQ